MKSVYKFFLETFRAVDFLDTLARPTATLVTLIALVAVAMLAYIITKKVVVSIIHRIALRSKTKWDDFLVKRKFFSNLAHLVPAFIIMHSACFSCPEQDISTLSDAAVSLASKDYYLWLSGFLINISKIYFVFIFIFSFNSFLNASLDIYNTTQFAARRPIKGYLQLVKILIFFLAGIIIISILLQRDPTVLLAGLGAMGAVLLLIFKDSILGFVASIQLSGNNMVKIGDWIEMRSRGADGTVTDITLNTVKVENFDKTISTIPTYAMVSESFINWKGMRESGGRRIKRSINIDMTSIKMCDSELLGRLSKFMLIRDYVKEKEKEIQEYNKTKEISEEDVISGRQQTNIGIFRKYLELYLGSNPNISKNMSFMVRHLQPTEKGLPIEIYVFSTDTVWANYEAIQADIFDHILAVIPEFDLRVFQIPSGNDFTKGFSQLYNK